MKEIVRREVEQSGEVSSESFDLRIFDPKTIRLFRVAGVTRMTWENRCSWPKVSVARAFPISDPKRYIGFLNGDNKDIGLVYDPAQLDPESQTVVEEELEKRYFVPVIRNVQSVKEEFGTVYWMVETDRGTTQMIVRNLRDNLQELSGSRLIVTDVDGNRFEFSDIYLLDSQSLGILLRNL